MAADDEIGWEINGRFYPHHGAEGLRNGDFTLIREVTGLTLDVFDSGTDPIATETGWMAAAFWQGNPDLRRDQVVRFVEQLKPADAKRINWVVAEATVEADADGPPPVGEPTATSSGSSTGSGSSSESNPEPSPQNGSGQPASTIGVPA